MILAGALLLASINVEIDLGALFKRPKAVQATTVTCSIATVGYRFSGQAGQEFRYAGVNYKVPAEGSIELIATPRRTTYAFRGRSLPLEVWPYNQFGFREVPLPAPTAVPLLSPAN